MSAACYKCGAFPGNPIKTLDVLKTIACTDCGTIACVKHRKGAFGGTCPKCDSARSYIAAMGTGMGKKDDKDKNSTGGSFGGGSAPAASADVSIGASTLKQMQTNRMVAEQEGLDRIKELREKQQRESLSKEEQERLDAAEAAIAALTGDKKVIMDHCPAEKFVTHKVVKDNKPKPNPNAGGAGDKPSTGQAVASAVSAVAVSVIGGLYDSGVESKPQTNNKPSKPETPDTKEDDNFDLNAEKKKVSGVTNVTLSDVFCVKANERININDGFERKKAAEKELADFIKQELKLTSQVNCTLNLKCLIPIDHIDHLLNLDSAILKENKTTLITGFLAKSYNFENQSYLEQLEHIISKKDYISGIYGCFSNKSDYSYDEQKDVILKLLDIAQESNKTFYIGLEDSDILLWEEIFDEYDLSEIDFIYTDLITNDSVLEFIKNNNITLLIRPDADMPKYAEIIKDYDKFAIGSAFEKNIDKEGNDDVANSIILSKIIKNMHNIDENILEQLLNC